MVVRIRITEIYDREDPSCYISKCNLLFKRTIDKHIEKMICFCIYLIT